MYIRMIYHMPKAIGWHGDTQEIVEKIVKIFAILKNRQKSLFGPKLQNSWDQESQKRPEIFEFHFET